MSDSPIPRTTPDWFRNAILYQIFPPSFQDGDGDGIGDLPGIIRRLDYIRDLGVTALWLSPIYDSPFLDAGYDVRDFRKVAPRYGTLEDFETLCREAHDRGLKVLLDWIPCHTSLDHPWFLESRRHGRNEYTDHYIWTDGMYDVPETPDGAPLQNLRGWGEREGTVATNFFSTQPKLNYGYADPNPAKPYQVSHTDPAVQARWTEMMDVARFWLDRGADGFRVDSAKSLVVGDPRKGTAALYNQLRDLLEAEYPEAVLIAEWGWPCDAEAAGFHGSMLLHNMKSWVSLVAREGWENYEQPPFLGDEGDIVTFTEEYQFHYDRLNDKSHICFFSCNHDYKRPASERPHGQMFPYLAMILGFPGTPILYYGDEIGMTFLEGLPSKEGGYRRTGSRTPMQWDEAEPNLGFSTADPAGLYLPFPEERPLRTVAEQSGREDSLLEHVRRLTRLRRTHPALAGDAGYRVVFAERRRYPFVFLREAGKERILVVVNPSSRTETVDLDIPSPAPDLLAGRDASVSPDAGGLRLETGAYGWAWIRL